MKRPIGAGFRFWRFRLWSVVLRPLALGSGQPRRWPIRSPLTQSGPHFHHPRQLCCSLELLHSMKVQSHPPQGGSSFEGSDPPQPGRLRIGSRSIPVPSARPGAGRLAGAGPLWGLATPKRAWMLLKPPSALAPGLSRRLHTSTVPETAFRRNPIKPGGLSDSCAEPYFLALDGPVFLDSADLAALAARHRLRAVADLQAKSPNRPFRCGHGCRPEGSPPVACRHTLDILVSPTR